MINWGAIPAGSVIPFPFDSFGTDGESLTLTGLAVADIIVYKGVSMTQRSSTAGFALMDTDGIDIDTRTGIQGFSIDTSDNTDSGFYSTGGLFWVVVDAVTINAQTVRFVAGTFRLVAAEVLAGYPKVDTQAMIGVDLTTAGGLYIFGAPDQGTLQAATGTTAQLRSAAAFADNELRGATILITSGTGAGQSRYITGNVGATDTVTVDPAWNTTPTGSSTYRIYGTAQTPSSGAALTALDVWTYGTRTLTGLDEDTTTLDLDATIRAAMGLATANVDTQFTTLQGDTNDLQARLPAALVGGRMDSNVGAIANNATAATNLSSYMTGATILPVNIMQINSQGIGGAKPYNTAT
jgi:hypothetical protein